MKSDKELEKEIEEEHKRIVKEFGDVNCYSEKEYNARLQLLGRKEGREQATSDILKKIDKLILNNEERDSSRVIKQNVRWELEELKQKIQGVKGE